MVGENNGANSQARIKGFDGVRALAVISVVLTHLDVYAFWQSQGGYYAGLVSSINGGAGVQAFFVLSGYLITSLLVREYRETGRVSLRDFYMRRSLRIFPLYYLVLMLVLVMQVVGEGVANSISLFFAFIYSYNFIPKGWYSGVLGHTWSLSVEEHFYLIWPFLFVSLVPRFRYILRLLAVIFVVSFLLAIIFANIDVFNRYFFVKRWTFIAGSSIVAGVALAILLATVDRAGVSLARARFLLLSVSLIFVETLFYQLEWYISQYIRAMGFVFLFAWLVGNQDSWLVKVLEIQPLKYIGLVSYGVYMWQGFFLSTGPYRADGQTWPPDPYTGFLLLLIVVPISYHFFEKPLMGLRKRRVAIG
ncbi:acyltransferase [Pseudomonas mendocina]|uniref:acyltransferase family protein n=1 Tax=Ectopseudomonas mendocina TaxID=300 RepID=UPI0023DB3857|nr:acyltransferase [Pseudomonas mendocina]MDF2073445.1 acyltransferase [Pseudomonas mendocina]